MGGQHAARHHVAQPALQRHKPEQVRPAELRVLPGVHGKQPPGVVQAEDQTEVRQPPGRPEGQPQQAGCHDQKGGRRHGGDRQAAGDGQQGRQAQAAEQQEDPCQQTDPQAGHTALHALWVIPDLHGFVLSAGAQ